MTHTATAQVPTAHASKYLQQLCKHWQHNLAVAFTADHGTVTFPRDARGADWPTIPQLYVKGEFVGGSDIMMEMWEAGELHQLVNGLPARAD